MEKKSIVYSKMEISCGPHRSTFQYLPTDLNRNYVSVSVRKEFCLMLKE